MEPAQSICEPNHLEQIINCFKRWNNKTSKNNNRKRWNNNKR